jgi:hypothetical protein
MPEAGTIGGVTVKVQADLSDLDRGFAEAQRKAVAFDKSATGALNSTAKAARDMGMVTKTATDGASSATSNMAAQIRLADKALADEARAARVAAAALTQTSAATKQVAADTGMAAKGFQNLARGLADLNTGAKLGKGQLANLSYQLNDVVSGLIQGQSPLQILTQQGGQVVQVLGQNPGGIGGSLKALAGLINPAVVGFGALAIAAGTLTAASISYQKATQDASFALMGQGAAAGLTAAELMKLASASAEEGRVSVAAATAGAEAYLRAGVTSSTVIKGLIGLQRDFALVTGMEAKDAVDALARAMADPINGVDQLEASVGALDDATKQLIIRMARENDLAGAQAALIGALEGKIGSATTKVYGWAGAYNALAVAASNAWTAMGQFLNPDLDKQIGIAQNRVNMTAGRSDVSEQTKREAQAALDLLKTEKARLDAQTKRAAETQRTNNAARAEREALNRLLPQEEQRNRILGDRKVLTDAIAKAGKASPEQAQALAAADRKLAELTRTAAGLSAKPSAGRGNSAAERLREDAAAMEASAKGALALADAYLASSDAAMKADASRQALTRAAKSGADAEAQTRRQLAITVAETAVTGAKSARALMDQTEAQKAVNNAVEAGLVPVGLMGQQLADEAALRPLIKAQLIAEGDAKATLERVTAALTKAQADNNAEAARTNYLKTLDGLRQQNDALELQLRLINATNSARRTAMADAAATGYLDRAGITDPAQRAAITGEYQRGAGLETATESASYIKSATDRMQSEQDAWKAKAAVIGMTDQAARQYLVTQQLLNDATRAGIKLAPEEIKKLEDEAAAYTLAEQAAKRLQEQQDKAAEASKFMAQSFSDAITGMIFDSKSGEDAVKGLIRVLAQAAIQALLLNTGPFASAGGQTGQVGGVIGNIMSLITGGPTPATVLHGGTSGPSMTRSVPSAAYLNAPRLHSGFAPDEYPAILQDGEAVLSKRQVANAKNNADAGLDRPGTMKVEINLKGANGDKTIQRIAGQAAAAALKLANREAPARDMQYRIMGR